MTPFDTVHKAADLRSKGVSEARAGRFREARAAFLESLDYDPGNADAFLWLAGLAPTKRQAYQYLDRARQVDPDHPHLARAAEGIRQHFADLKQTPSPVERRAVPVRPPSPAEEAVQAEESAAVPRVRVTPRVTDGLLGGAADLFLRLTWRFLSMVLLLVALIFFEALVMELGQEGDLRALSSAVPSAADFTVDYVKNLSRGDMGVMASRSRNVPGTPVVAELRRALPPSLGLLAVALMLATLVGLILGIGAALRRETRVSGLLLFASVLGVSTPSFFAAMLLIWFGVWLYQRTSAHVLPISGFGWDAHLILPSLVLAARPAAAVTRLSYNALVEILEADYIRTAVAKGLRRRVVLLRHVLRNAGVPILTTAGASLRFSLAVLPHVEYIFNWPGIGLKLLTAIQIQDATTVVGMTLPLVLLFALINQLLEILCPLIDPRLRASETGAL
jgi:peptide/nickel transport system permease protein